MADTRMRQRLRQYRLEREVEDAWHKLVKGQNYRHIERGWVGRFDGIPSDNFTAWMTFDFGQCGVDPRKLEEAQMTPPNSPNSSPELTEVEPDGLLRALPASVTSFIVAIQDRTPNGEWIAVQYHPDGEWSVAHEALSSKNELPSVPMTSSPITDEMIADILERLNDEQLRLSGRGIDQGCVDSCLSSVLALETISLIEALAALRSSAPSVMGMEEMVERLMQRLKREAANRNSAYDRFGMDNTPQSVDPELFALLDALSTPLVTGRE
jgi:hypothetical protein